MSRTAAENARPYAMGGITGLSLGILLVHPLSMSLQGLVHPRWGLSLGGLLDGLNPHHLPMALLFGLAGMALGLFIALNHREPTRKRSGVGELEGLVPICAWCKKIRDDSGKPRGTGDWFEIDRYIASKTQAEFTHGICPECLGRIEKEIHVH